MDEDDLIPLSYLSQYYYCPRRAGLLLVDQQWADNAHTAEGTLLHERAHDGGQDRRGETLTLRGLLIRSLRLGVAGKADCVEAEPAADGVALAGRAGRWQLRPVEYKHGEQRAELEYEVQLCAQAMCLEEMLDARIVEGNLFYAGDHRRVAVALDARLRELVEVGARALHAMLAAGALPLPRKSPRCRGCSMVEVCEPRMRRSAVVHLAGLAVAAQGEPG